MILLPENKWYSSATLAKPDPYEVLANSTYTLTITGVSEDAIFEWFEGGFRDENENESEFRWYPLTYHTKNSIILQTDNNKFHYCKVTQGGVSEDSGVIYIKVTPYEDILAFRKCYGKYGPWCLSCGAECYRESGPPELDQAEPPYRPGEDFSEAEGVEFDYAHADSAEVKETGRLDLRSIITKAQNILKMWVESTFLNPKLNPTVDHTDQVDELFESYGLDIETPEGQDTFHELQTFEKTNSAEKANTEHLAALLEPFNDALCCLQNEVDTYKPILWMRAPHIFFRKHCLVNSGYGDYYFRKASAIPITVTHTVVGESNYEEIVDMGRAVGVLLRIPRYRDEIVPILTCGVIKQYDPNIQYPEEGGEG